MTEKYVSLSKLSTFLDNLKKFFAAIQHTHTVAELTDYTVDTELSTTSTNAIQNKAVTTAINEFSAVDIDLDSSNIASPNPVNADTLGGYRVEDIIEEVTPVKGTDYYTEADKTEMVNRVISALPTWAGGSY